MAFPEKMTQTKENTKGSAVMFIKYRKMFDCIPKRYVFSVLGFLASLLSVTFETCPSIAIVSMVDRTNQSATQVKASNECIALDNRSMEIIGSETDIYVIDENQNIATVYYWSPELEGVILGATFYGQMFGYVIGGRFAEVRGGKFTVVAGLFTSSFFTTIAPFAAYLSVYALIVCRFIIGCAMAPIYPSVFYLVSRWIPLPERSFTTTLIFAGYSMGIFLSFLIAGYLCSSPFFGGWPSVFYVSGASGLLTTLLCYIFIYETPESHPTITSEELEYISKNRGSTEIKRIKSIPWKSILSSIPFWALAIGSFGQFWILGFFSTVQSLYLGTILLVDSKMNGILSCLPSLFRSFVAILASFLADWMLKRGYISVGFIRKGATLLTTAVACVGFVAILFAGCNPVLNTTFFVLGSLLGDFATFGVCMAVVDIAPNLSGTLSGVMSTINTIPYFVIPALVGVITNQERSMSQWRYVYYCTIGVVMITMMIYVIFGTSEPQPWGADDEISPEVNKEKQEMKTQPQVS